MHSFNRYAYANNNPFNYTDPTGMASEDDDEPKKTKTVKEFERKKCQQTGKCESGNYFNFSWKGRVPEIGEVILESKKTLPALSMQDANKLNADQAIVKSAKIFLFGAFFAAPYVGVAVTLELGVGTTFVAGTTIGALGISLSPSFIFKKDDIITRTLKAQATSSLRSDMGIIWTKTVTIQRGDKLFIFHSEGN